MDGVTLYMAWANLRNLTIMLWVMEGYSYSEHLKDIGSKEAIEITCGVDWRWDGFCWGCDIVKSNSNSLEGKWWIQQSEDRRNKKKLLVEEPIDLVTD